jgi:6,7-dimethyl-8-ribityllumazine synthase
VLLCLAVVVAAAVVEGINKEVMVVNKEVIKGCMELKLDTLVIP